LVTLHHRRVPGAGGRLMIHTDVNRHTVGHARLHQILNGILYLNEDWKDEYGGHLELWNRARQPETSILPTANRFVLFATGTKSLHGHPRPLTPPPGRRRNSLAVYYYVLDRPTDEDYGGYQTSVDWVPTEPEDFQFMSERTREVLDVLNACHQRTVEFPRKMIPPGFLPDAIMESFTEKVPLLLFDWDRIPSRSAFTAQHLGALEPSTLRRLRPFALAGVSDPAQLLDRRALTLLVDTTDGKFYLCLPTDTQPRWLGYEDLLRGLIFPGPPRARVAAG
jgi:hypothetical protein